MFSFCVDVLYIIRSERLSRVLAELNRCLEACSGKGIQGPERMGNLAHYRSERVYCFRLLFFTLYSFVFSETMRNFFFWWIDDDDVECL